MGSRLHDLMSLSTICTRSIVFLIEAILTANIALLITLNASTSEGFFLCGQ